jgi:hypothetical protein
MTQLLDLTIQEFDSSSNGLRVLQAGSIETLATTAFSPPAAVRKWRLLEGLRSESI